MYALQERLDHGSFERPDESQLAQVAMLDIALGRSAEYARERAVEGWSKLNRLSSAFAAGQTRDFSPVSHSAHLAAFELMTYGELCAELGVLPLPSCEAIASAGCQLQLRALEHEALERAGNLSPGFVFYDDLISSSQLELTHRKPQLGSQVQISSLVPSPVSDRSLLEAPSV